MAVKAQERFIATQVAMNFAYRERNVSIRIAHRNGAPMIRIARKTGLTLEAVKAIIAIDSERE